MSIAAERFITAVTAENDLIPVRDRFRESGACKCGTVREGLIVRFKNRV